MEAISVFILIGIVIGFSGVLYAFTDDIVGNWRENVDCTINKVNIIPVSGNTVLVNYFIGFTGIDNEIMEYGLHFLDSGGDIVQFISVNDLGNQTISLLDTSDNTTIMIQKHAELQKTIGKTMHDFNTDNEYLAIGTIKIKANGQQISECTKITEIR